MSGQCPYDVIQVADTGIQIHLMIVSSQCPDTGIQEKEWCHPSALTTWIQKT
ncbi:hypothetical protein [Wolbachia endosymbiont (group A) of Anomoia purmunda]|uniref:hypothetical protein n=1 Tax=Wolbachia endosymbiont (group A) of Anomoia purmunda TaxID=2953978 RepID=UPI00222E44BF|nr:hypothetical protein [Wolbachia endosymbiont (group A) of Anomoia purmunda]